MEKPPFRLLLSNIKQLLPLAAPHHFIPIQECSNIHPLPNYSIAIDPQGYIAKVAPSEEVAEWIKQEAIQFKETKDCSKLVALPGLVDAHTHALFAGNRSKEFDMKLNGLSYVDIYNEGLGIRYTTASIREAKLEDLVAHLEKYVQRMNRLGTTTVEVKSGYGLNAESEVKMLRAIELVRAKLVGQIDVIATFCGAHAIPKGLTEEEQTKDVLQHQIPAVQNAILNEEIRPKFIDVFCEKNFFERQSSRQIMKAGRAIGLTPSFHGDELSNLESGLLAAEVGARAVSHLEYLSEDSTKALAQNNIAAVLLPTTQNIEKLPIPPIKLLREHNVITALGSDFCPNAHCYNMALVCHLACTNYRMTPKEALAAATINSAYALGVSESQGSLEVGKKGDVLLLDVPDWVCLMYHFGDTAIEGVVKEGNFVR